MWFGRGSDVVRMCFRRWLGCVFGSGADGLAEAKGKWFPALLLDSMVAVRRGQLKL